MKYFRYFISFLFIVAQLPLFGFAAVFDRTPIFGSFGFNNQITYDAYQQYVGKTVIYLPCMPLSNTESSVFKTQKFIPETEYIIENISPKSGYAHGDLTISFKEKKGNNKLKIKVPANMAYEYPFFFIDDFNLNKNNLIGKSYSDPKVKGSYVITDVRFEKPLNSKRTKGVVYYVSNPVLNINLSTDNIEEAMKAQFDEDKSGGFRSNLIEVEKPKNASEKFGDIQVIKEKDLTKYSFEDEFIRIIIYGTKTQFHFKLTNKSQNSIKIVWDDAVFVDYSGSSSKIMHTGIKFSQKEASQPATTIIRGSSLDEIACPTSNVRYSNKSREWVIDEMYPKFLPPGVTQLRLMLPIQIKDVTNEYVFVFNVEYCYNHPDRLNISL